MELDQVVNASTNLNASLNGTEARTPPTPEGLILSSTILFIMAIIPIYLGSQRSTRISKTALDLITMKDALMFPILASCVLMSIYLIYKYLPTYYINLLVSFHFTLVGINGLVAVFCPLMMCLTPGFITKYKFHFEFTESKKSDSQWEIKTSQGLTIHGHDIPGIILSVVIGVLYLLTKNWITNNFIAIALSLIALEYLRLEKFTNGFVLLGILFFYDIFWVFGTPVMVSVAKNLDAPIKVVFPRDFLTEGVFGREMALLGLGDIVIPGIFVAMLLRFDKHLNRGSDKLYFYTGYIAYIIGLLVTFLVMHVFKSAQPALLYLVPACLGAPTLVALLKGDMKAMLDYRDESNSEDEKEEVKSDSSAGTGSDSAAKKNE